MHIAAGHTLLPSVTSANNITETSCSQLTLHEILAVLVFPYAWPSDALVTGCHRIMKHADDRVLFAGSTAERDL